MADTVDAKEIGVAELVYEEDMFRIACRIKWLFLDRLKECAERYAIEQAARDEEVLVTREHLAAALRDTAKFILDNPLEMLIDATNINEGR